MTRCRKDSSEFSFKPPCNTEGHIFKGLVFCFSCLAFFVLGFLISENLIRIHKSNDWNDSIIPAAAHITRNRDKCEILVLVCGL